MYLVDGFLVVEIALYPPKGSEVHVTRSDFKLRVNGKDGKSRPARGDDVTHVRWTLQAPVPAGQGGSVSYRAVVR